MCWPHGHHTQARRPDARAGRRPRHHRSRGGLSVRVRLRGRAGHDLHRRIHGCGDDNRVRAGRRRRLESLVRDDRAAARGIPSSSPLGRRQRIESRARRAARTVADDSICRSHAAARDVAADHAARARHAAAQARNRGAGCRRATFFESASNVTEISCSRRGRCPASDRR